jgi:hypothetical protein
MPRPDDMTRLDDLAARHPHGVRVRYICGCRCMLCRAANSRYQTQRDLAKKNGDWNGIIPALRAREHLKMLQRRGIGRRLVAEICGVSQSMLADIKQQRKLNIRARTERAILSVTLEARANKTLVKASHTWALLNSLLREGFTQTDLARRLGSRAKTPALQIRGHVVTAENAMKVERLYRQVMAGSGYVRRFRISVPVAQDQPPREMAASHA